MLAYLLLRWTGLRGGDAVRLTWEEIDFDGREINRLTQKRKKRVIVPISPDLLFVLEAERDRRAAQPWDRVLAQIFEKCDLQAALYSVRIDLTQESDQAFISDLSSAKAREFDKLL